MHHHEHAGPNWNVWRSLIFLSTVAIALVLNGATSIGSFAAIVAGFVGAAAVVSCVFFVVHGHDSTGRSDQ
ncbi:MAG TPA: hypothetical protein VIK61_04320 [Acidimicrobiia bacterium]